MGQAPDPRSRASSEGASQQASFTSLRFDLGGIKNQVGAVALIFHKWTGTRLWLQVNFMEPGNFEGFAVKASNYRDLISAVQASI